MRSIALVGTSLLVLLSAAASAQPRRRAGAPELIGIYDDHSGKRVILGAPARDAPRAGIREIPRAPFHGCCSPGPPIVHFAEVPSPAPPRTFTIFTEQGTRVVPATTSLYWRIGGERGQWREAWTFEQAQLAARVALVGAHPDAVLVDAPPRHERDGPRAWWDGHVRTLAAAAPGEQLSSVRAIPGTSLVLYDVRVPRAIAGDPADPSWPQLRVFDGTRLRARHPNLQIEAIVRAGDRLLLWTHSIRGEVGPLELSAGSGGRRRPGAGSADRRLR